MVDMSTQYSLADIGEPLPQIEIPVPTTCTPQATTSDDLNQSFLSDSSMEIEEEDEEDDPDYQPDFDFDMEVSDSEERYITRLNQY